MEYLPKKIRDRVNFSRCFLAKIKRKERVLKCHYCPNTNLKIQWDSTKYIKPTEKATIDHVVPVSKGGKTYDTTNLVVACEYCNAKKGNMDYEQFKETLQNESSRDRS